MNKGVNTFFFLCFFILSNGLTGKQPVLLKVPSAVTVLTNWSGGACPSRPSFSSHGSLVVASFDAGEMFWRDPQSSLCFPCGSPGTACLGGCPIRYSKWKDADSGVATHRLLPSPGYNASWWCVVVQKWTRWMLPVGQMHRWESRYLRANCFAAVSWHRVSLPGGTAILKQLGRSYSGR